MASFFKAPESSEGENILYKWAYCCSCCWNQLGAWNILWTTRVSLYISFWVRSKISTLELLHNDIIYVWWANTSGTAWTGNRSKTRIYWIRRPEGSRGFLIGGWLVFYLHDICEMWSTLLGTKSSVQLYQSDSFAPQRGRWDTNEWNRYVSNLYYIYSSISGNCDR